VSLLFSSSWQPEPRRRCDDDGDALRFSGGGSWYVRSSQVLVAVRKARGGGYVAATHSA